MTAANRLLPRTLRGRLIAGLVALLAIASASVGLVTYFAVRGALTRELNSQLQTATDLAYNCWEQQNPGKGGEGNQPDNVMNPPQGSQNSPGGTGNSGSAANSGGTDSGGTGTTTGTSISNTCPGLGEHTFVAVYSQGSWHGAVVGDDKSALSDADKDSLLAIDPWQAPPGVHTMGPDVPSTTHYLSGAGGTFLLTAVRDPDTDG